MKVQDHESVASSVSVSSNDESLNMITKPIFTFPDGSTENGNYGACTYSPIVAQSKQGLAKFYSILFYMVRHKLNT